MPRPVATAVRQSAVTIDGIRSPVLECGPAHREEAVVFVHGNPGSSRDWEDLAARVGAFARAVAFDMPGFGQADKPADFEYTVPGYAAHLDRLLAAVNVRRAHLVLHDFGGPWGLTWAATHPARVASFTLINIGVLFGYRWHRLARIWRTPILGELFQATATRAGFRLSVNRGNPRPLPRSFVDRMYDDYDRGTRRAILKLYRASDDPGRLAEQLAPALRALNVPVLVIWGRNDPYVSVEHADRQRDVFARAQIVILDQSGHWPFADDPEAVAAVAVPFLRQHYSAASWLSSAADA
jgi:pimeloyl-ACP methyl ester carboxylesterase